MIIIQNFNINISSLKEPFVHITKDSKQFSKFYAQVKLLQQQQLFYTLIDGKECTTKEDLFGEFSSKLLFPAYFSANWDSFDEIINDLEWLDSNQFVLFFKNFDLLLSQDSKSRDVFLETLSETMKEWIAGNDTGIEREPMPFCLILHSNQDIIKELNFKLEGAKINIF